MITEAILNVFSSTIQFLLGLLPSIPQFPAGVLEGLDNIVGIITGVVGLISYLESPLILGFVLTALVILLNFDNIYKLVKWFYHLVRG